MDVTGPIWFSLVVAAVIVAIVLGVLHSNRVKKQWSLWARARHWEFIEHWRAMPSMFTGGPFGRGSGRRATLGFLGRFDGVPAGGFRYQYTTGSGDNSTTHHHQILFLRLDGARFPDLALSRENWGTRTFVKDLQFEDAAFNDMWNVRGDSPRFAHDVIHPRMMEFLKGGGIPALQAMWFERDHLVFSRVGHLDTGAIDTHLRFLTQFLSRIPSFVLDEVGVAPLALTWDGPGLSPAEQASRLALLQQQDQEP